MAEMRSRLSSKGQMVVPKAVRQKLNLKTGDLVRFRLGDRGTVTIAKVEATEDDPFASFDEWNSAEDEKLYADL